jgi:hypothetical protein
MTERNETPTERLDRNWAELLQELRVVQTGVQFLTGFLLTLPFQQRFLTLSTSERVVYLTAVGLAVLATALLITPVALHRVLFRQHERPELVAVAHRFALFGYWLLGLAITVVVLLIFDVTQSPTAGVAAAAVVFVVIVGLWGLLPGILRRAGGHDATDGERAI